MKNITKLFFLFGIFIAFAVNVQCAYADEISTFTSHVELNKDGTISVQEEILFNFDKPHHGIYREIPLYFKRGDGVAMDVTLTNLVVTDGKGGLVPFDVDGGGNFVRMKIGDPNIEVKGEKFYVIRYSLLGAMTFSPDEDVFFWDATTKNWEDPIKHARTEVALPKELMPEEYKYSCYHVSGQSVLGCDESYQPGYASGTTAVLRFDKSDLAPHDSMVVGVSIKHGYITEPKKTHKFRFKPWWNQITPTPYLLIPLLLALTMMLVVRVHNSRFTYKQGQQYTLTAIALAAISAFCTPVVGLVVFAIAVVVLVTGGVWFYFAHEDMYEMEK